MSSVWAFILVGGATYVVCLVAFGLLAVIAESAEAKKATAKSKFGRGFFSFLALGKTDSTTKAASGLLAGFALGLTAYAYFVTEDARRADERAKAIVTISPECKSVGGAQTLIISNLTQTQLLRCRIKAYSFRLENEGPGGSDDEKSVNEKPFICGQGPFARPIPLWDLIVDTSKGLGGTLQTRPPDSPLRLESLDVLITYELPTGGEYSVRNKDVSCSSEGYLRRQQQ
jgi:hypothetical protein